MDNSVSIKGFNHGIAVVLDSTLDYEVLKEKVAKKFRDSAKFMGKVQMALRFEGKELTDEQQIELMNIICDNSELEIVCLLINDPVQDEIFRKSMNEKLMEIKNTNGQFYKGNLRSGQSIDTETSIVVIGDVNPGASIISKGNIVILGSLRGTVYAGSSGNEKAFVLALDMSPVQIRIADTIARSPDNPSKSEIKETKIAFLEDNNIYIEPVTKKVLSDREL